MIDLIVIGGGAAGIFAALQAKEKCPESSVLVLEKTAVLLSKVRVSGGGRCNATHSCFDEKVLASNYPRGSVELLGPFSRFQPKDTIAWFESRGVQLKAEADGRMFPVTDSSQTIIDCFLGEAKRLGIEIRLRQRVERIQANEEGFTLHLKDLPPLACRRLILATGSSAEGHRLAGLLGHTIEAPVPSLFTFNVPEFPLADLSGISTEARVWIEGTTLTQQGPLLITHFGFSGPAALKLSAWGARELFELQYKFRLRVNWLPQWTREQIFETLKELKKTHPKKLLAGVPLLPKQLWKTLVQSPLPLSRWSYQELQLLSQRLSADSYQVEGKTTHKEEFVTCGGVKRSEVNWKTMESKMRPGLYFAGEVLDVDGVTGGFNFQHAWTTGAHAGRSAISIYFKSVIV